MVRNLNRQQQAQNAKKYSRVLPENDGDNIVISGMAGKFPNSESVLDFEYNLFNKIDMVDDDERRWKHVDLDIPKRCGKIYDIEKFDATFFGVHHFQAQHMDPQNRLLLETAYEAIMDAGINPKTLQGSNTGIYIGASFSEVSNKLIFEYNISGGLALTGCCQAMLANRVSFNLGLTGPSYFIDTTDSSSMSALDCAFSALRSKEIDSAIVGGANLALHPQYSYQFCDMGLASKDGYNYILDERSAGYTRAEAISCIFLQRKHDAKRIYATVVYSKTNSDGYKEQGITYPASDSKEKLLRSFYTEANVDPNTIPYIEAHCSGTVEGDSEECHAIDQVLLKGRKEPLKIGTVKSNMGHAEAVAGICSVVKVLLSFQKGIVPPMINFKFPRKDIPALAEGRLQVVTDFYKLSKPLIAINSFGFGGCNAHALLKGYEKIKINNGIPTDHLPRLVHWSGRTGESVKKMLLNLESNPLDTEYLALLYNIQSEPTSGFLFRGYGIYEQHKNLNAQCLSRDMEHFSGIRKPLVWVFSGMGSQWVSMGTSLMQIPMFRESITKSHNILKTKGFDLIKILTQQDEKTFDNIIHSFVGIAAIQIAITDILKLLDMVPDYIIGHSVGELGCAYADNCITAKQMLLAAYSRGIVSYETEKVRGSMAAVGIGFKDIFSMLPESVQVACHNSAQSCTISGPSEDVAKFVAELKSKGYFAKEVPCSNIAYHSKYIAQMGPGLLKLLREIIPEPKKRSDKWLSTSVPFNEWHKPESQLCSAEYHTNNLLSSVLFEEASSLLPDKAITVEIAPHGLLQAILKKSHPSCLHVALTQRDSDDNMLFFLKALGKLYINGIDIRSERLYPAVQFPVSCGTKSISSYLRWDHSQDWYWGKYENREERTGERFYQLGFEDVKGHVIDGRVFVPATYYLKLVWETFLCIQRPENMTEEGIVFKDVRFLRGTLLNEGAVITLTVMIHVGTGIFEVTEAGTIVVSGIIRNGPADSKIDDVSVQKTQLPFMTIDDFYKELRIRGYHYNDGFKSVQTARVDGLYGKVKWEDNWITFMDCLMQMYILGIDTRSLMIPTRIEKLRINSKRHLEMVSKMNNSENKILEVYVNHKLKQVICGGVEILGLHASPVDRCKQPGISVLESYQFIPHIPTPFLLKSDGLRVSIQLVMENSLAINKMTIVEVDLNGKQPIVDKFRTIFEDTPVVKADLIFLTKQKCNLNGVHIDNVDLSTFTNITIIISSEILKNRNFIESANFSLNDPGYIISRESLDINLNDIQAPSSFKILAILPVDDEMLILMKTNGKNCLRESQIVRISETDTKYLWIEKVQNAIKNEKHVPVILVAQNEPFNGILGLVNCLRKESNGNLIKAVFIDDPMVPEFDINLPLYKNQLILDLGINVYKNGKWGTYRHLQLNQEIPELPQRNNIVAFPLKRGDLSSWAWFQGHLTGNNEKIKIIYSSLNFHDLMLATGRLSTESSAINSFQPTVFGMEFSGVDRKGKRYMGMVTSGALASHIDPNMHLVLDVPNHWTLKEAATVPVIYITIYWAFFFVTDIRNGKSILIHSGSGGIGLAAIRVALANRLEVFTTVDTPEKKQYLLKTFPQLKESHIGNSRDTSFEVMVKIQTNGKGVDFVLNSLSEDKLIASIRCLAIGGHFLEIGKFDISNDNKIGIGAFLKELSFHAISVDNLINSPIEVVNEIKHAIYKDIASGIIQPIPSTVFLASQLEQAFRYMAAGKHIGKILVEIRKNAETEDTHPVIAHPRIYFDPKLVIVISGGLGGIGLELVDWMILRGARKFILNSSRGITKSYQTYRIKICEGYGATIVVNTDDITTSQGCKKLIESALKLGPIGSIFNLAVILRDSAFEEQTSKKFAECMAPKAVATKYLDEISRSLCPHLQNFVVFSSMTCGRGGNDGQTNYGMANSVMERIVEARTKDGLPAKAIQWGAVEKVGIITEFTEHNIAMESAGILQQRISSCLNDLDVLLNSDQSIVASMIVSKKRSSQTENRTLFEIVLSILGIHDQKTLSIKNTLSEIGMDSFMEIEIKQTFEQEFELYLSSVELRHMTLQILKKISESKMEKVENEQVLLKLPSSSKKPTGMGIMWNNLGDERNSKIKILPLYSTTLKKVLSSTIIIPGIEGVANEYWYNIGYNLPSKCFLLQLTSIDNLNSIKDMTNSIINDIKQKVFKYKKDPFYILGYSFGSLIALELAKQLEDLGYYGQVILIDGSPKFLKALCSSQIKKDSSENEIQNSIFSTVVQQLCPDESHQKITANFAKHNNWNKKTTELLKYVERQNLYSAEYCKIMMSALYNRLKILINLNVNDIPKIESPIILIRPMEVSVVDIDERYDLQECTTGKVTLKYIKGNHTTILESDQLIQLINNSDPSEVSNKLFGANIMSNRI